MSPEFDMLTRDKDPRQGVIRAAFGQYSSLWLESHDQQSTLAHSLKSFMTILAAEEGNCWRQPSGE